MISVIFILICLYKPRSFWIPADPWKHSLLLRFISHYNFSLVLSDGSHDDRLITSCQTHPSIIKFVRKSSKLNISIIISLALRQEIFSSKD